MLKGHIQNIRNVLKAVLDCISDRGYLRPVQTQIPAFMGWNSKCNTAINPTNIASRLLIDPYCVYEVQILIISTDPVIALPWDAFYCQRFSSNCSSIRCPIVAMTNPTTNPLVRNADSQGNLWVEVTIPLLVLTAAIVALRVWWRRKISGTVAATDIAIVVSLVSFQSSNFTIKTDGLSSFVQ